MNHAPAIAMLMLCGCSGVQTSLGGQGVEAASFISLFKIFLAVTFVMYALIIGFLLLALKRRGRADETAPIADARHPQLRPLLIGWTGLIAVGLSALAVASFLEDRTLASPRPVSPFAVEVTANQWWWDIRYVSTDPSHTVRTVNELHLPLGVPVKVTLKSNDVIHSLWIPNLAGKQDLIPGRTNDMLFEPTKAGLYRGQCAEFCGLQHTNMALDVTVESPADFQTWWSAQLAPAKPPASPEAIAGQQIVESGACAMCHAIAGTKTSASVGPDLTHVASRRSLAAGTLPMSRAMLEAWVGDPQKHKPGSNMPKVPLTAAQLHAVGAYLEGLK